ncbi:MAG: hypothetical protein ACI8V5_001891, partial [Limisphaerales bacterium]
MNKPWHLDRRTFLKGTGVSLALPLLAGMDASAKTAQQPRRFAAV